MSLASQPFHPWREVEHFYKTEEQNLGKHTLKVFERICADHAATHSLLLFDLLCLDKDKAKIMVLLKGFLHSEHSVTEVLISTVCKK